MDVLVIEYFYVEANLTLVHWNFKRKFLFFHHQLCWISINGL